MGETNELQSRIQASCAMLRYHIGDFQPEIGIILGSGLGVLAEDVEDAICVPYCDVPYMGISTTASHVGRFVFGKLAGKSVVVMQGRLHGYEGYTPQEIAYPVWLMNELGVKTLITTNAAGAINPTFEVGDFCLMSDHINFTGGNPIVGHDPGELALRFFSMYDAYDPQLRTLAKQVALECDMKLREGVYLGLLGPSFETPAEIRAFAAWGADTVAMSVIHEVIAARHVGIRVLGMSLISNMACGVGSANPTDYEVFQVALECSDDFCYLMRGIVSHL